LWITNISFFRKNAEFMKVLISTNLFREVVVAATRHLMCETIMVGAVTPIRAMVSKEDTARGDLRYEMWNIR
jgi:hypothetical protein